MKRFVVALVMLIWIPACAAPVAAPTAKPVSALPTAAPAAAKSPVPTAAAAPTGAPKPTAAPSARTITAPAASPQATRPGIAVVNLKQEKQADGSIRTTANVTAAENLGVGQIELASPDTLSLNESRSIRLRISPAQQLVALPTVAAPAKTPELPGFTYRFGGNIELYPLMFAELRTLSFEVDQKGPLRRIVESSKPAEWVWVVRALAAGRQELAIEISIPVIINGVASEMSTHVLQDLPVVIQVAAPTAVPPTPVRSGTERIWDSVIDNAGAVIAAVIGLLGTLLGGWLALRARR